QDAAAVCSVSHFPNYDTLARIFAIEHLNPGGIEVHLDSEIGSAPLNSIADSTTITPVVIRRVAHNDHPTASSNQLVQAQVLEMTTIRQMDHRTMIMSPPSQF